MVYLVFKTVLLLVFMFYTYMYLCFTYACIYLLYCLFALVNDTLDDMLDESGDEEEQDAIVTQVLDEIGIDMSGKVGYNYKLLQIIYLMVIMFLTRNNFSGQKSKGYLLYTVRWPMAGSYVHARSDAFTFYWQSFLLRSSRRNVSCHFARWWCRKGPSCFRSPVLDFL